MKKKDENYLDEAREIGEAIVNALMRDNHGIGKIYLIGAMIMVMTEIIAKNGDDTPDKHMLPPSSSILKMVRVSIQGKKIK